MVSLTKNIFGFYLFGHNVLDKKPTNPQIQNMGMELKKLDFLISTFKYLGYSFVSMEDSLEFVSKKKLPAKKWIHLTFDDGYRNNYLLLYPYLKKQNIPFTIFVSTKNIVEGQRFDNYRIGCVLSHSEKKNQLNDILLSYNFPNKDHSLGAVIKSYKFFQTEKKLEFLSKIKPLLSLNEWKKLDEIYKSEDVLYPEELYKLSQDPIVHIGSHGHNHYILSTLKEKEVVEELSTSRINIHSMTGNYPFTYCYPNGKENDIPKNIEPLIKNLDYTFAFTTKHMRIKEDEDTNLYKIPRFPLSVTFLPKLFVKIM